jgi:hypothetical protein
MPIADIIRMAMAITGITNVVVKSKNLAPRKTQPKTRIRKIKQNEYALRSSQKLRAGYTQGPVALTLARRIPASEA